MEDWKEYIFSVNGFEIHTKYNNETVKSAFLPLLRRLTQLQKEKDQRLIVFMAAPPAVGKTTLTQFLKYLSEKEEGITKIQALGLDGFHYHSDYIQTHNVVVFGKKVSMKSVKGCPETFDTKHFEDKLSALKTDNVKWPVYDRNIHDVIEEAIEVTERIVLIEGNWLLLKEEPWKTLKNQADYTILIRSEEGTLKERLINRKMQGGISKEEAEKWYQNSDSVNVKRVLDNSSDGDLNLWMMQDGDYKRIKKETRKS